MYTLCVADWEIIVRLRAFRLALTLSRLLSPLPRGGGGTSSAGISPMSAGGGSTGADVLLPEASAGTKECVS